MKKELLLMALIASTLALYEGNTAVKILKADTFSQVKKGIWLVQFFAHWCGACKSLAPQYEKAAVALKGIANIAAIDASSENTGVSINGYPTIKLYVDNVVTEYSGRREASAIVQFMLSSFKQTANKRLGGSTSEGESEDEVVVLSDDNFQKVVYGDEKGWFVQFYAPWCGHCKNLAPTWAELAKELKGEVGVGKVDATVHTKVTSKFGVSGYPTLKFFPPGAKDDDSAVTYEGGRTLDAMAQWAREQSGTANILDITHIASQKAYDDICKGKNLCLIAFLPHILDSSEQERSLYLETFKTVALRLKSKLFKYLWVQGGDNLQVQDILGVSGLGYPVLVFVYDAKNIYGRMKGAFNEQNIESFGQSIIKNKQAPSKLGAALHFVDAKVDTQL